MELIEFCHEREVLISTGGFIERVLAYGREAVDQYIAECRNIGFDIVEILRGLSPFRWMTCCGLWNSFRKAA